MMRILIPLPNYGAAPTEVAIPWKLLSQKNYHITFTTPEGVKAIKNARIIFRTWNLSRPQKAMVLMRKSRLDWFRQPCFMSLNYR
jgi:hypothetical protein